MRTLKLGTKQYMHLDGGCFRYLLIEIVSSNIDLTPSVASLEWLVSSRSLVAIYCPTAERRRMCTTARWIAISRAEGGSDVPVGMNVAYE